MALYDLNGNIVTSDSSSGSSEITEGLLRMFRTVGVIGDSISSGTICTRADGPHGVRYEWSWLSILCRKYGFDGLNLARGGASAIDWADTFRNVWDDTAVQDAYIIALGTNDIGDTMGDEYSDDTTTFGGAYNAIIAKVKEKAPNCAMFCLSPYGDLSSASMSEINRIIRQIAKLTDNVFYVDIHNLVANPSSTDYKYWYNGHPNTIGNLCLANVIEWGIENVMINNWDFFADFGANQEGTTVNPLLGW